MSIETKLRSRTATVAVVGLGYVGLPLACAIAQAGFTVRGVEADPARTAAVNRGESYVDDVPGSEIRQLIGGRLSATTDYRALRAADVIVVCVPTPLTKSKEPDLSYLMAAARGCASILRPDHVIILESTTYPGTTVEIVRPILEESRLRAGADFFLAFSPERIDPGNRQFAIVEIPKVVGGLTPACTHMAQVFYEQVFRRVVPVSSPAVAEMVKCYENVFRNVNIALVNELTLLCERMGISMWEVIDAAATKPYGFMPFYPGPGVGGHCIPVDPYYLLAKAREYDFHASFIELATTVNDGMPYYVVSRTTKALDALGKTLRGARILILGVAYKRDVSDPRMSPSLKIMELLHKLGAHVSYHDPYVPQVHFTNPGTVASVPLNDEVISSADCVIIATDHDTVDYQLIQDHAPLVIDTRNRLRRRDAAWIIPL